MAFVRKKQMVGGKYFQLVESRRVDGKPRQRVLLHLGEHATVDDALKRWPHRIGAMRRKGNEDAADALKAKLETLRKLRADGVA